MNFNWREYLTLSEGLKAQPNLLGTPEASFRSAASRAYYAAYQCALEYACTEGFHHHRDVQPQQCFAVYDRQCAALDGYRLGTDRSGGRVYG